MKKIVSPLLLSVLVFALSLLSVPSLAGAQVDPQEALQILSEDLKLTSSEEQVVSVIQTSIADDKRDFQALILNTKEAGDIQILISAPKNSLSGQQKLPILFVSAGFASGMEAIRLFSNPGNMIIVGYQYPFSQNQIEKDFSLFPKMVRLVPGQIALSLEWLSRQPFADASRLNAMGVSLGSLFLPVSLRLAQLRGVKMRSTTLAYGGSDLRQVVDFVLPEQVPDWIRNPLLQMVEGIFILHNPKIHLPHLQGQFNCVYGTHDQIFSSQTSQEQFDLLSGPKEIHWISGPHIDVNQPLLIQQTTDLTIDFLKRSNQIDVLF